MTAPLDAEADGDLVVLDLRTSPSWIAAVPA